MVFQERRTQGRLDLEAALRSAMHQAGAAALTQLLRDDPPPAAGQTVPGPCGHAAHYPLQGAAHEDLVDCPGASQAPFLRVAIARKTSIRWTPNWPSRVWSPRRASGAGKPRRQRVAVRARLRADETAGGSGRHRQSDRTRRRGDWHPDRPTRRAGNGARQTTRPARGGQTEHSDHVCADGWRPGARRNGRNRRTAGPRVDRQRARTRECKLGCGCTQTTVDDDGWAVRNPDSTTYAGTIETAEEFGLRLYTEAWRRGWEWATRKVVIGDGAVWI